MVPGWILFKFVLVLAPPAISAKYWHIECSRFNVGPFKKFSETTELNWIFLDVIQLSDSTTKVIK